MCLNLIFNVGNWPISNFGFSFVFIAKYCFYHHLLKSKKKKRKIKTNVKSIFFHYQSEYKMLN